MSSAIDVSYEELDIEFKNWIPTPGRVIGSGGTVWWKNCASVTITPIGEQIGAVVPSRTGKKLLQPGFGIIFIGEGGCYKAD